jgi:hypothetical protein
MSNIVGFGIFTWEGFERRSNRYGSFTLCSKDYNETTTVEPFLNDLSGFQGKRVRIVAKIITARESGHLGDKILGIYPSMPEIGEEIEIGVGIFNCKESTWNNFNEIFLLPNDGRNKFWIDPHILYQLHDQTVEIYIEETDMDFSVFDMPKVSNDVVGVAVEGSMQFKTLNNKVTVGANIKPVRGTKGTFSISPYEAGEYVKIIE